MRLIILIPLIAGMDPIEIPGFSWSVLVFPVVGSRINDVLFNIEEFLLFIEVSFSFGSIECLGCQISSTRSFCIFFRFDKLLSSFGDESGRGHNSTLFELDV